MCCLEQHRRSYAAQRPTADSCDVLLSTLNLLQSCRIDHSWIERGSRPSLVQHTYNHDGHNDTHDKVLHLLHYYYLLQDYNSTSLSLLSSELVRQLIM